MAAREPVGRLALQAIRVLMPYSGVLADQEMGCQVAPDSRGAQVGTVDPVATEVI
jgi:hypothetical protein